MFLPIEMTMLVSDHLLSLRSPMELNVQNAPHWTVVAMD